VESKLSPLGTSATYWPIVPAPGDCEVGEFGEINGKGNRSTRRKPTGTPLCPPQIPLDQTRDWTRAAAVGSQRLTASAMARADIILLTAPRSPWFLHFRSFHQNMSSHGSFNNTLCSAYARILKTNLCLMNCRGYGRMYSWYSTEFTWSDWGTPRKTSVSVAVSVSRFEYGASNLWSCSASYSTVTLGVFMLHEFRISSIRATCVTQSSWFSHRKQVRQEAWIL
jgi:hypothetical protein